MNKCLGQDGLTAEFHQTFKELVLSLHKFFQKIVGEWTPPSFHKASIIQIEKQTKISLEKNYRPMSLMNMDIKFHNKILATWKQHI